MSAPVILREAPRCSEDDEPLVRGPGYATLRCPVCETIWDEAAPSGTYGRSA